MITRVRAAKRYLIALVMLSLPSLTAFAQEDPGPIETVLNIIRGIIEFISNTVGNFFNFLFETLSNVIEAFGDFIESILTAIGNVVQAIINFLQPLIDLISEIINAVVELIEIGILIVQIIVGLIGLLGAWLFQVVTIVTGFLGDFFSATPTAIPGAPQCITAPTSHDLCAIWYIGDHTIFSGAPGALIVTIILIIIDVSVVFIFVRKVMQMLRAGETITDVG